MLQKLRNPQLNTFISIFLMIGVISIERHDLFKSMYKIYVECYFTKQKPKQIVTSSKSRIKSIRLLFTHHTQLSSLLCSYPLHIIMQPFKIECKSPHHCCCFQSRTCALFFLNPSQSHVKLQNVTFLQRLAKSNHMHLVHNVRVHNSGINDMEHASMPPFVIPPL